MRTRSAIVYALSGMLAVAPTHIVLHAQSSAPVSAMTPMSVVASNVAIGSGTAVISAWRGGRPLRRALWRGAMGGAVMGGGFAVAGVRTGAARFVSVQTVAVGASMARNAAIDAPVLSHLVLPFSPFVVELRPIRRSNGTPTDVATASGSRPEGRRARDRVRVRVSGSAAVGLIERWTDRQGLQVDWRETLQSGAIVLRTGSAAFNTGVNCPAHQPCERAGNHALGTVAYAIGRSADARRATLAHESVHAAQHARDLVLFGVPAGDAAVARGGRLVRTLGRIVIVDIVAPLKGVDALSGMMGTSYTRWYEREARTFAPGSARTFLAR